MHGTSTAKLQEQIDLPGYLNRARERGYRQQIHDAFARADKLKIAFVGELIIDEYCYVKVLGKSAKEPILVTTELRREQFLGGAHAASLHAEWPNTSLVTESMIRKTRFVDVDFGRKLFEVYDKPSINLVDPARELFHARVREVVKDHDVVVVCDFGHGLLDKRDVGELKRARFLAVNSQTNAGNYGFNPVTHYRGANYVCVDEPEARLAVRFQHVHVEDIITLMVHEMPGSKIAVTRGRYGCAVVEDEDTDTAWVPPLAVGGLDTIGAGDAFLAVSAPLVAAGLELEAAAFVGNIAGAIKVGILGHQRHVTRAEIMRTIDELLP